MLVPKAVIRLIMFWLAYRCLLNDVDGLVFKKILKHENYPGKCFPVHTANANRNGYVLEALNPGEERPDPNVCGVTVCMNAEGEALVYHCPLPILPIPCAPRLVVSTHHTFPECCWICSTPIMCASLMAFPPYHYPPPKADTHVTG